MRMMNIASGSSGNATYIGTGNTHILVDAGISRKRIADGLKKADISLNDLDAILITHEHIDHIGCLGVVERTRQIPVYATAGTIRGIRECKKCGEFDTGVLNKVRPGEEFSVGDITVKPLGIWHDAYEPVAYRFESGGRRAAVVTDLGDYDDALVNELEGLDGLMLEANHDVRMLEAGPYPYPLKQRILGKYGHLSNENSGQLLVRLLHDKIKYLLLGHVSFENNTRDLAKLAVENEIEFSDNIYKKGDFEINVASRSEISRLAEF